MNNRIKLSANKDRRTSGPDRGDQVLAVGRSWPGKARADAALLPREGSAPGYAGRTPAPVPARGAARVAGEADWPNQS